MEENKLTFHINNMAYTIVVDKALKEELTKHLPTDKNLDTRELLAAYIRMGQEIVGFKESVELISEKISNL
jgi:hypothetical protein